MKSLLLSLVLLLSTALMAFDENPHAQVSLQSVNKDGTTYLVPIFKNDEHWHTYWKNPGDAGTPIEMSFELDGKIFSPEALEWPLPKIYFDQGDLLAFGYDGEYAFFFKLSEKELKDLEGKTLTFKTKWLICNNVCIWGEKQIFAQIKNKEVKIPSAPFEWASEKILSALEEIPSLIPWPSQLSFQMHLAPDKENLIARYEYKETSSTKAAFEGKNLLIPFPGGPFVYKHETLQESAPRSLIGTIPVQWEGKFRDPEILLPVDGIFKVPFEQKFLFFNPETQKTSVVRLELGSFLLTPPPAVTEKTEVAQSSNSLIFFLFLAFVGGLILNLMPCVFPVISLKLFGLIKKRENSPKTILLHNIFYSLGVLFSFLTLAVLIILLKKGGEEVGWGFQLQSPLFISCMIIILFIFTINLFGLFEFKTPGGQVLGNVRLNEGFFSNFLEGIIATVLATPCSAPFLGTALTFAFSSSPLTIALVFIFISLGLASPFILIGIFPSLIKIFPRPGHWMGNLRKFLGLTLIFTIIWLIGVLLAQTESILSFQYLMLTLALIFFAIFFSIKISPLLRWRFLFAALITLVFYQLVNTTLSSGTSAATVWEKWTPEKMNQKEKILFIDFSADWCLTCKVNERIVLQSDDFKKLTKKYDLQLLLADWTKKDSVIGDFLRQHGSNAVPAYFIQDKKGTIYPLGETISVEKIESVLIKISEK